MPTVVIQKPTSDLLGIDEAKAFCDVTHSESDAMILDAIKAATRYVQDAVGQQFLRATYELTTDAFPTDDDHAFRIPFPPLAGVDFIKYVDTNGETQTLASTDYIVDDRAEPGRVVPAYGTSWPTARAIPNSVTVRFQAGHLKAEDVSDNVKHAVRLLTRHYYVYPDAVITGTISKELEFSLSSLIAIEKNWSFGEAA